MGPIKLHSISRGHSSHGWMTIVVGEEHKVGEVYICLPVYLQVTMNNHFVMAVTYAF